MFLVFSKLRLSDRVLSSFFLSRQVLIQGDVYSRGCLLRNIRESDSKALRDWKVVNSIPNGRSAGLKDLTPSG